jgi:hypothetical protein
LRELLGPTLPQAGLSGMPRHWARACQRPSYSGAARQSECRRLRASMWDPTGSPSPGNAANTASAAPMGACDTILARGGPRPPRRAKGEGCPRELGYNEVWTPNVVRLLQRMNESGSCDG